MADHPFKKDLGYLFPFFERVEAYGAKLPTDRAQALSALLQGEAARWRQIAALLEGEVAASGDERPSRLEPSRGEPAASEPSPSAEPALPGATRSWTIGPLRSKD